jgi:hypothetical protein
MQVTAFNRFYHCCVINNVTNPTAYLNLVKAYWSEGRFKGGVVLLGGGRIAADFPTRCPDQAILTSHGNILSLSVNMINNTR